jgi:flagellar biosynthesis/type III secretory pathway protein FliH
LEEYNEELHIRNEKEISYEEGLERGLEQGMQQGLEQGADVLAGVIDRMRNGETAENLLKTGVSRKVIDLASKYA